MENSSRRSFLAKLSALALAARTRGWAATPGRTDFCRHLHRQGHQPGHLWVSLGCGCGHHDARSGWRPPPSIPASWPSRRIAAISTPSTRWMTSTEKRAVPSPLLRSPGTSCAPSMLFPPPGGGPCNVAVDYTGKAVFVANYGGGSAASFRVLPGGGLSKAVSSFQYTGHGADPERQARSSHPLHHRIPRQSLRPGQ